MFRSYWIKFRSLFIDEILCRNLAWFMARLSMLNPWSTIWISDWKTIHWLITTISRLGEFCLIWRIKSWINLWWLHSWWRVYSIFTYFWRDLTTSWTCIRSNLRSSTRSSSRSSSWTWSVTFPRSTLLFKVLMQLSSLINYWSEIILTLLIYNHSLRRLICWWSCSWWPTSWWPTSRRLSSLKTQLFSAAIVPILESPQNLLLLWQS